MEEIFFVGASIFLSTPLYCVIHTMRFGAVAAVTAEVRVRVAGIGKTSNYSFTHTQLADDRRLIREVARLSDTFGPRFV